MRNLKSNLPLLSAGTAQSTVDIPILPREFSHPGLSMAQIIAIVWAYRKHTIVIAAALTIVTAVTAKFMAKSYTATATMMVSSEVSEGGKEVPINVSYVSTQIDLMQSAEVLLPVVERLNLKKDPQFAAGYRGDGNTLGSYVVQNLGKNITIQQGNQGNQLIYVTVTSRYPVQAAAIANAVGDAYIEKQRGWINDPVNERARQYSEQLAELQNKVKIAQDQVTAYRQKSGITDATAQNDVENQLLTNLEQRLQEAQNLRRAAEAKASDVNAAADAPGSNLTQGLKTQLAEKESQLAQLRTTLGPQHPKVLELLSQIESTKHSLAIELQSYSKNQSSDLNAARQLEEKIAAAVADQRRKVFEEGKLRDAGAKLLLELESAQSVYKRALDGYDQIMFASGRHETNVTFVSRAVPPVEASKPNKVKLVIMGMLAGCFLGMLGPLAFELLVHRRVRCRDDYERDFGLPVLAEFDAITAPQAAS